MNNIISILRSNGIPPADEPQILDNILIILDEIQAKRNG